MVASILILVLAPFAVITGFVFVFTVVKLLEQGGWMPWYVRAVARVWLVIGYVSDVVFNVAWGSVIFRERPHELLFTSRVKRHYNSAPSWRQTKARQWREFLNAVDPGHVR